ncbi:MAG: insulinase family protein, partial [Bacteroidales bacterium]
YDTINNFTFYRGMEDQSRVLIMFKGDYITNDTTRLTASILSNILNIRLRESLREDKGGVYSVRANLQVTKIPRQEFSLQISFGCNPSMTDSLTQLVFNEMKKLLNKEFLDDDIFKSKETIKNQFKENYQKNNYWISSLYLFYNKEISYLKDIEMFSSLIDSITKEDLYKAVKNCFRLDAYKRGVLQPLQNKK